MIQQFEQIDKMMDRLAGRMAALQKERDAFGEEITGLKGQLQEKDIEIIRIKKDMQRAIEQLEREKMGLQKDMKALEIRLGDVMGKIRSILPDDIGLGVNGR